MFLYDDFYKNELVHETFNLRNVFLIVHIFNTPAKYLIYYWKFKTAFERFLVLAITDYSRL